MPHRVHHFFLKPSLLGVPSGVPEGVAASLNAALANPCFSIEDCASLPRSFPRRGWRPLMLYPGSVVGYETLRPLYFFFPKQRLRLRVLCISTRVLFDLVGPVLVLSAADPTV